MSLILQDFAGIIVEPLNCCGGIYNPRDLIAGFSPLRQRMLFIGLPVLVDSRHRQRSNQPR